MSWKTHCVGRVMMSMPEDRKLTWSTDFDDAIVKRLPPMSEPAFWDGVELVRKRYLAQTHDDAPSRLAHFEKVGNNAVFVFHYDNEASFWGPVLERYVYLDRDHAYELRFGMIDTPNVAPTPELFKPYVARYTPILERIHPLQAGQFPSRDGLCVDGAVISGDTGRNARAALISELAHGTELVVAYNENNYKVLLTNSYEELKYEEDHAHALLDFDAPNGLKEYKVIRKRERSLSGIAGQEYLTRATRNDGHIVYSMQWAIKGQLDGGILKPAITVSLNTPQNPATANGKPYATLPPEAELIKLWDYALSTFKWRVGALPDGQQIQVVN